MSLGSKLNRNGKATLPYQEKVIEESTELATKIFKLSIFFRSNCFKELPKLDRNLLVAQRNAMMTYASILDTRICLFDL